jgi:hypothetical protein
MKYLFFILVSFIILASCQNACIEQPKEDVLPVLEAPVYYQRPYPMIGDEL